MNIIKKIWVAIRFVLKTFFGSGTEIMSDEVKEILANPIDKKKYLDALVKLRKLREDGKQGTVKISLSSGEDIELTT